MSKRALLLLLALLIPVSFLGCGGGKDEDALLDEAEETTTTAAAPAGAPAAAPAAAGTATVTGKVAFEGTAPSMEKLKMDADAFCKAAHTAPAYSEQVVVNANNTLQWFSCTSRGATGTFRAGHSVRARPARLSVPPHVFGIQAASR